MVKLLSKLIYSRVIAESLLGRDKFPQVFFVCLQNYSYNQKQKLLRQPHKCPPHPQFNVVWMTEKRKFNPLFPTLIMGAGGRPKYFKMAKNVKSLIIFARDSIRSKNY
jgi:hypothetical protein